MLVVPADDFPLFSIGTKTNSSISETEINTVVAALATHLMNLKRPTGIENCTDDCLHSQHHNHSDDKCQSDVNHNKTAQSTGPSKLPTHSSSGRLLKQITKPEENKLDGNSNKKTVKAKSGDLKKSQTLDARWAKAIVEYKKLTGNTYEKEKGDRIDIFERLILKLYHDKEVHEQKEKERKEKDKQQKEKEKREKEQKEKDRLAKIAADKAKVKATPSVAASVNAPTIALPTASAHHTAANLPPIYAVNDVNAPISKCDIDRVDSYRKMFHKSMLDTMIEAQEQRDLQTFFSQSYQTGTRKLILPNSAALTLTLGKISRGIQIASLFLI